jgi:ankyrin repeat protein
VSTIPADDPLAVSAGRAIRAGDVERLRGLLAEHPELARARIGDDEPDGMSRTLLHAATDWPGHFPNGPAVVAELVRAGADVDARFRGPHTETPLHWAASSNDVAVLDALLDAGADIEAPGAVIGGGSPLADARAFGNREAALRLVERGAHVDLMAAATLGLMDRLEEAAAEASPSDLSRALWGACHGAQRDAAQFLLDRGADPDWVADWEPMTALDAARRSGANELSAWLAGRGARAAAELG